MNRKQAMDTLSQIGLLHQKLIAAGLLSFDTSTEAFDLLFEEIFEDIND